MHGDGGPSQESNRESQGDNEGVKMVYIMMMMMMKMMVAIPMMTMIMMMMMDS